MTLFIAELPKRRGRDRKIGDEKESGKGSVVGDVEIIWIAG